MMEEHENDVSVTPVHGLTEYSILRRVDKLSGINIPQTYFRSNSPLVFYAAYATLHILPFLYKLYLSLCNIV
jgi:hypothetical protein